MDAAPVSCATCGWRGMPAGPFCPSCGAQLTNTLAQPIPQPHIGATRNSGNSRIVWQVSLLAVAVVLLIVFTTLFIVGLIANPVASADAPPTLAPEFSSATALLTVAPQTPSPNATDTPKSGGGGGKGGKPTATPLPTATAIPPTPTDSPIPIPSPTICGYCG